MRRSIMIAVLLVGRVFGGWLNPAQPGFTADETVLRIAGDRTNAAALVDATNALARAMLNFVATNDPCSYPVLLLPMGGQWTDFELKASTNNFSNLCYYVMSSGTNAYTTDTNVWVYFTDDYAGDVRQWHRSAVATAIGCQLVEPTHSEVEFAVVYPSHECAGDWQRWMSRTNDRLVWSFVRYDGIGLEMNATGTKTHWNPVVPVEWRKARTAP